MTQRHNRKAAAKVRVESNELHACGREPYETGSLFAAEAAYADSIFRTAFGDSQGCSDALRRSLECMPIYAPALLSLGTVEYQLGHQAKGWNLFMKLFELPADTKVTTAVQLVKLQLHARAPHSRHLVLRRAGEVCRKAWRISEIDLKLRLRITQ